jgi:hypothetical protein
MWILSVRNNIQIILQFVRKELITHMLREVYAVYMNFFVNFETQTQQSTFQNGISFLIFGVFFYIYHYVSAEIKFQMSQNLFIL